MVKHRRLAGYLLIGAAVLVLASFLYAVLGRGPQYGTAHELREVRLHLDKTFEDFTEGPIKWAKTGSARSESGWIMFSIAPDDFRRLSLDLNSVIEPPLNWFEVAVRSSRSQFSEAWVDELMAFQPDSLLRISDEHSSTSVFYDSSAEVCLVHIFRWGNRFPSEHRR
jgi:hypothetical protein